MKPPILIGIMAALIGAQSTPPRKDIPAIAKAASGAVVSIIMSDKDGHPIAQGSGFIISRDGRIVTNYHVIKSGSSAIVKLPDGAFCVVDGMLAFDKARDVAIIKAHGENFRTVTLGNSDQLQVGEEVVAIGSPLSLESTVSNGILSGIRTVGKEGGKFLQVTAPISPGSSGGPLFNMAGEVVGVTSLYLKGGESLNFAVPVNDVKLILKTNVAKLIDFPDRAEAEKERTNRKKQAVAPSSTALPNWVPPDWQRCPKEGGDYYYGPACTTTARVIAIRRAAITEPGLTVEDYATCIKRFRDLPDESELKTRMSANCKNMADLGIPPGSYPPTKEPGYIVTFETPSALYVASTKGVCTHAVDGRCGGDWAPDVVVGQTYEFTPPGAGETLIDLGDPHTKDNPAPYVRLMGHLESVVEKKPQE